MVASLLKVISTGIQDERLQPPKDQPSLDSFQTVFIKAGRYGTQWVKIDFDTLPNFGTTAVARLPVYGELVARVYLVTQMPDISTPQLTAKAAAVRAGRAFAGPYFSWTNSLGHALINEASLFIGGSLIDAIPGNLMEVLDEFQTPLEKTVEANRQLCRADNGFNQQSFGVNTVSQKVVTPLPFWFTKDDPALALPIDALNVDEVRINISYNPVSALYYTNSRIQNLNSTYNNTVIPAIVTNGVNPQANTAIAGGNLWPLEAAKFYEANPSGYLLNGLDPLSNNPPLVSEIPGISIPSPLSITDAYLLVEYIYLDKPEANRFRIADIQTPIVQHYAFDPADNQSNTFLRTYLFVPNPTRDLFFYCNRYEAPSYNAPFLATRDLSNSLFPNGPWWPDASGLGERFYGPSVRPGFSTRDSEPIRWLALTYEETLTRYSTENVALFRSMIPAIEQRKAPWVNRYYYHLPFSLQSGMRPISLPAGEANLDKIQHAQLSLGFHGQTQNINDDFTNRFITYIFAQTYNILRIYGGRATTLFAY